MGESPLLNRYSGPGVAGEDVLRLAVMLEKKLPLLEGMQQRQRVRKDPRLAGSGIGFHEPVRGYLEKNWRLIVFLAESALGFGHAEAEAYRLLARGLSELGEPAKVLEVADAAREQGLLGGPLAVLRLNALLELGRDDEARLALSPGNGAGEEARFLSVVDYPDFDAWCAAAGAEKVALAAGGVAAEGLLRFFTAAGPVELDNRIVSTPLFAARVAELEVLAGYVPCKAGVGYSDAGLRGGLTQLAPVLAVSKNRLAYRAKAGEGARLEGDYVVPSASHQYFGNYFHALCQICCRLALALDSPALAACKALLPQATPKWALQFLEFLGIGPQRVAFMPAEGVCRVERGFVLPMKWDICPAEIAHARSRLLAGAPPAGERPNYFLLRRNVQNFTRALVDEERFIAVCEARGFQVVDPLDHSLAEQAALFRDAGILVSSSSSACTNMLFTRPGADIVLMLPKLFWGMLYDDLATACGHAMSVIFGDFVAGSNGVSSPHHPYAADPDLLAAHLDGLLERRACRGGGEGRP